MIQRKTREQLDLMRASGQLTAAMHEHIREFIKPGISTREIDRKAEAFYVDHGAKPIFKGYGGSHGGQPGFPGTLCTSINEEIVHGIPSYDRVLEEGDLIKLDAGCALHGWVSDSAVTWMVGADGVAEPDPSTDVGRLVTQCRRALWAGIMQAVEGNRLGDIGHAIDSIADTYRLGNVRDYVGHGVGRNLHEDPQVPHYGRPGRGLKLMDGLVIAIEPMFNLGTYDTATLEDGWTVVTADGAWSAHWEHTVAITPDGPWVLTARSDEPEHPEPGFEWNVVQHA